jgi:hypothetical protein
MKKGGRVTVDAQRKRIDVQRKLSGNVFCVQNVVNDAFLFGWNIDVGQQKCN